jgi:TPP-dependent pyruvate/acetoin dehydrogenase alpha subunit
LTVYERYLEQKGILTSDHKGQTEERIRREIDEAQQYALHRPYPKGEDAVTDVYAVTPGGTGSWPR